MSKVKNVPNNLSNKRLDKVAAEIFPNFSRTQIKKWILDGRILVNGDFSKPKEMGMICKSKVQIFCVGHKI